MSPEEFEAFMKKVTRAFEENGAKNITYEATRARRVVVYYNLEGSTTQNYIDCDLLWLIQNPPDTLARSLTKRLE